MCWRSSYPGCASLETILPAREIQDALSLGYSWRSGAGCVDTLYNSGNCRAWLWHRGVSKGKRAARTLYVLFRGAVSMGYLQPGNRQAQLVKNIIYFLSL